ncbi:MAG: hypothetical protein KKD59_09695 [Acidobacteria bacterium]|nr:hypothetical protein [Acidobacteriota bacterium]
MRIVKLKQDRLNSFLEAVSTDSELWGPVKKGADKHRFKIVDNPAEFDLDYTRTILPPKKIFLPPRFNMFKAMPTAYEEETMDPTKKILFGGFKSGKDKRSGYKIQGIINFFHHGFGSY